MSARPHAPARLFGAAAVAASLTVVAAAAGDDGAVRVLTAIGRDGAVSTHAVPSGAGAVFAVTPEGVSGAYVVDPHGPKDVIVQFDAPPTARARRLGIALEATRAPYELLLRDLPALEAAAQGSAAIRHRFEVAFNGVAMTAPLGLVERIRALPYVRGVFPDDTVRATLHESVPIIHADRVHADLGARGEGVVVSVLDTGIDYTHPALGGCFGPGCRVVAGFDIRNGDPDPMDDNGHGTHVAGIIGGAETIVGVAPAVRFHAYKVLDQYGYSHESFIIMGIERSLDPDRNPLTDDAVDVINLSLSGPGDAGSPLSQAVDEAVAAGVVCVVAAGNGGYYYFNLGTPASARGAITVGSVNKLGYLSLFSSRGPAAPDFAIKPDLTAPGEYVISSWPGGQYQSLSGTSMAAPHVAGTAALLRQLHPDWSAETVKSVMVNTASRIFGDLLGSGAGQVDALAAATAKVAIVPGTLTFGVVRPGAGRVQRRQTLRIANLTTEPRHVTLSPELGLDPGVSVALEPSSFDLGPSASVLVAAVLTVEASVPPGAEEPFATTGGIVVDDGSTQRRVPFAFHKSAQIVIELDPPYAVLMLHDRVSRAQAWFASGQRVSRLTPPGVYDLIALFGDTKVVREGIDARDSVRVTVRATDAIHEMRRITIDERGNRVYPPVGVELLMRRGVGIGFLSLTSAPETVRLSEMSDAYTWEWTHFMTLEHERTYSFLGSRRGAGGPHTFQNAPGDLVHTVSQFHFDPGVDAIYSIHYLTNGPRGLPRTGAIFGTSYYSSFVPPIVAPFRMESYSMPSPDPEFGFDAWWKWLYEHEGTPVEPRMPILSTGFVVTEPGELPRVYAQGEASESLYAPADGLVRGGFGPPTWLGRLDNDREVMRLRSAMGNGSWLFALQGGDWRDHYQHPFRLYRDGVLAASLYPTMGSFFGDSAYAHEILPGRYRLETSFDRYFVDGWRGLAMVEATFDSRVSDRNPPYLKSVEVLADGIITDRVEAATLNELSCRVADDAGVTSFTAHYRLGDRGDWAPLATIQDGERRRAILPDTTGDVSLRIEAADATGNTLRYTMEPAVHIGPTLPIESIRGEAHMNGRAVRLHWSVPRARYEWALVQRIEDGGEWRGLGFAVEDGAGGFVYDDEAAEPDRDYGYRLGLARGTIARYTAVTEIRTPSAPVLSLAPLANPTRGGPVVTFALPDARPASLEVLDIAGRLVLAREVGALGPGEHRLDLSSSHAWRPGIYLVRLRHPQGSITRKLCLLR